MLAAILGKGLIEQYGWQPVFLAAGTRGFPASPGLRR
jgi:hypothetical protein